MARTAKAAALADTEQPRPLAPIRRFDVFAEYKRREAERRGDDPDEAAGYGIWVAKVVAGRRFGRSGATTGHAADERHARPAADADDRDGGPRELDGKPQTAETFEREIVNRMGRAFYERVFAPAIGAAFDAGDRYEDIRDRVRQPWKP